MKANYFKVGVFVMLATALIVVAVVILGAGMFEREGTYYETYFDTAVSGLSRGSAVELQGVKIGHVESVGFASSVYDIPVDFARQRGVNRIVRVVFSVVPQFKGELTVDERRAVRRQEIHSGLRVRLGSNLITGQAYLQGTYVDPNRFPVPEPPWEPEFEFVPSAASEFTTMKDSLDKILAELERLDIQKLFDHVDDLILTADQAVEDANVAELSDQVKGLLADARHKVNVIDTEKIGNQVEDLVANADGAVTDVRDKVNVIDTQKIGRRLEDILGVLDQAIAEANVAALTQEIKGLFAEARVTNQHLQELLARPEKGEKLANISEAVDQLTTTLRRVNLLIVTQAPRIEDMLENFQRVSDDVKDLSAHLKRNPSDLLLSSPPRESEVLK